jgi:hypothetical protein
MENIIRSIYGAYLQACKLMDRPFVLMPNSTLNEKFSIQQGVLPDVDKIPSMKYWGIGNGGHEMSIGAGGQTKTKPVQHKAIDAALYNHLPFVLRELTNDISPSERAKYALRRVETHNAVQYAAYYLRRLDFTGVVPGMLNVNILNGVKTTSAFAASSSNLNPTPPVIDPDDLNTISGEYVSASAQLPLLLDAPELLEFINAVKVIYDDDDYAIISEVALVSGIDKVVSSPTQGGGSINFNEVIAAQCVSYVNTFFAAKYANSGVEVLLDVGATEPLFNLTV